MEIVETSVFTKAITNLLTDEEYTALQTMLVINPLAGPLIPGGGGLRKIRWGARKRGKSGGIRATYYYVVADDTIFMLAAYSKSTKDDLTKKELSILRKLIKEQLL